MDNPKKIKKTNQNTKPKKIQTTKYLKYINTTNLIKIEWGKFYVII
jgi:hypothetical protein